MEEAKGLVKHVPLVRFKNETTPDQIEELIKGFANLVNLVHSMKSFHWGRDVSIENAHQGFTHVFEMTFESTKGIAEYLPHPADVEFAKWYCPRLEKFLMVDFRPTTFVEYSKMIYLDGDIQVFENIDHLFDEPDGYFYAVMDCFCEKTWSSSPQYKIGYCQQCPERVPWTPELGPPPPLYFNAGMFVYEPNLSTYLDLLETLKVAPTTPFAEQDFLNMYFRDMYKPIPPIYNLVLAMLWRHPENIDVDQAKVVHYCAAGSKPWRYTGKEENMQREDIKMLVKKWWDIYEDEALNYKNATSVSSTKFGPFIAALSEADAGVHQRTAPSAV